MNSILDTIKQSARERRILKIIYQEKDGSMDGWRYVEPYSFSQDNGTDGLFAWDINKAGIRRFSMDRIEDVQITDKIYNPRYEIEI
jgi:predicted DNA-binding transcriptional regulator YafY